MTAYGTTQTAIEAMRRGAYDYVTKPFKNEELKVLIKKALEAGKLMKESVSYQVKKDKLTEGVCIIGKSPKMLEIYKTIGKVADSNVTVLIRGDSGTGKELVARAIYQNSSRKDKPFLAVNCAAIPESLLESELFGHEKGAFTGAINKRIGKFQQCDGGTIFLDEIGDMSLSTQTKILRVLQEHTFQPVGSENTVKVDARVIASTNKDLSKAIEKGEFREDLYYRLKVITIYMPPLREKLEDIPSLVDYFIQKFNHEFNKNVKKISPEVIKHLKNYKWPGNVRELENAIQTAVVMSKKDVLLLDNFPLFTQKLAVINPQMLQQVSNYEKVFQDTVKSILKNPVIFADGELYKRVMADLEKSLIEAVLDENNKSQSKSAKILGISRNTLRSRMKEYGLQ
jgi:DNA-binding NtrC family response regulator